MSRITDKVMEEMAEWANRPLDQVYAAVFIDAIVVTVRDGQVAGASRPRCPCARWNRCARSASSSCRARATATRTDAATFETNDRKASSAA